MTKEIPTNEDLNTIFRTDLTNLLKENVCKVLFDKVDGTQREMICTLKPDLLPEGVEVKESKKKENLEVLAVYDLENNGWRSFRLDKLLAVSVAMI